MSTLTSTVSGGRIDQLFNVLGPHSNHVVCVNFIREWRHSLTSTPNDRLKKKTFHGNFIHTWQFCHKSTESDTGISSATAERMIWPKDVPFSTYIFIKDNAFVNLASSKWAVSDKGRIA